MTKPVLGFIGVGLMLSILRQRRRSGHTPAEVVVWSPWVGGLVCNESPVFLGLRFTKMLDGLTNEDKCDTV